MKMYRNVLFAVAGMAMLFAAACSGGSPFTADVTTPVNTAVPVISVQPAAATNWNVSDDDVKTLTVTASVTDGGTLSYQWYTSAGGSANGNAINGQTSAALTLNKTAYGANGDYYFYVVVTNTNDNATGTKTAGVTSSVAKVTVTGNGMVNVETEYTIVISTSDNETGDTVTASPDTGKVGDTITLAYAVANTKIHNLLDFGGVTVSIDSVNSTGTGTRTYVINAADASLSNVITITAIFNHTNLVPDPIEFTETGHITKTYGDAAFINAVAVGYKGSGAITYSSSDTTVATVNIGTGQVTIHKVGFTIITAEKAADATYAYARAEYTLAVNSIIEMVPILAGTFTMGSPTTEADRSSNETQHSVTLSGFYMGKYQVTQEQYQAVMGSNPSNFSSSPQAGEIQEKRPVERVSWYDALVFCNKLSTMEGLTPAYSISGSTDPAVWGSVPTSSDATWNAVVIVAGSTGYRLPTEAQWEYACRAGTTTAYNTGETISDNTGWYTSNSGSKTHQVGLKPANAWGLYDMHGNVWEWCWDWYSSSYYSSSPANDPMGASSGSYRVRRGGGWVNDGQDLRSAYRSLVNPSNRRNDLGFRLVRS